MLSWLISPRVIAFRYIPTSVVSKPVGAVWMPLVQEPWYRLSYPIRLSIGWLCLLGIIFGSAFGTILYEHPYLPNLIRFQDSALKRSVCP
jgi:hypothetical protein